MGDDSNARLHHFSALRATSALHAGRQGFLLRLQGNPRDALKGSALRQPFAGCKWRRCAAGAAQKRLFSSSYEFVKRSLGYPRSSLNGSIVIPQASRLCPIRAATNNRLAAFLQGDRCGRHAASAGSYTMHIQSLRPSRISSQTPSASTSRMARKRRDK